MNAAARTPPRRDDREPALLRSDAEAVATRGGRRFGALLAIVLGAMTFALVAWARFSVIDDVARGEARVIAGAPNTVLRAPDAGVVKAILVKEGDVVAAGQALVRIELAPSKAAIDEKTARLYPLTARAMRLAAEAEGKGEIAFPDEVRRNAPREAEQETAAFRNRARLQKDELATLEQWAAQTEQQLRDAQSLLARLESRLRLNRAVETDICGAYRNGSTPFAECQAAQRVSLDTAAQVENARRAIPRAEAAWRDALQSVENKRGRFLAEARKELSETEARIAALRAEIKKESETPVLAELRAPLRGIVKKIGNAAQSRAVKAGDALIEIVPVAETLLVEAKIAPTDIAFVRIGQPATVKIAAYDHAIFGALQGKVVEIASDARVRVRTEKTYIERDQRVLPVVPGMSGQVDIRTGQRTLLDRLLDWFRRPLA